MKLAQRSLAPSLRRLPAVLAGVAGGVAALALAGCLMPRVGTPVYVDSRAGDFWSGRGRLIEVSPDEKRCRVAVRDRALLVRKLWVNCARLHPVETR